MLKLFILFYPIRCSSLNIFEEMVKEQAAFMIQSYQQFNHVKNNISITLNRPSLNEKEILCYIRDSVLIT